MELETFSIVLYVFCTLFAACLGSFSNVVIYRVPNHKSIVFPPSACPKCGARIKPYDNIPVLSWLILRGRCRHCKAPISPQYPIVEAVSGLFGFLLCRQIFASNLGLLLMEGGFLRLFLFFVAMSIFVVSCLALAIIDIQKTEIPPEIALPVAALGVVASLILPDGAPFGAVRGNLEFLDSFLGAGIGAGLVLLIIGLYYLLTRRIGMGGGDVWMLAMIGAFLGWQSLIFVFLATSRQGLLAAVSRPTRRPACFATTLPRNSTTPRFPRRRANSPCPTGHFWRWPRLNTSFWDIFCRRYGQGSGSSSGVRCPDSWVFFGGRAIRALPGYARRVCAGYPALGRIRPRLFLCVSYPMGMSSMILWTVSSRRSSSTLRFWHPLKE